MLRKVPCLEAEALANARGEREPRLVQEVHLHWPVGERQPVALCAFWPKPLEREVKEAAVALAIALV